MAAKGRRYLVRGAKAAAGTMLAAATVAAMTAFAPLPTGSATANTTARAAGVQQDLARAVALRQVTPEQASRFEQRLLKRIKESES